MDGRPDGPVQHRIGRLASLMAAFFAVVALRLAWLQILERPFLLERSRRQQYAREEVPGVRGTITDRYGRVLAESVATESVFCSPSLVKPGRRAALAATLARTLGLDAAALRRRLVRGRPFWVVRRARVQAVQALEAGRFPSLSFQAETRRVYPQGDLACHVLGYCDVDGRGLDGVELSYQRVLGGRSGEREVLRDAAGRRVAGQQVWLRRPVDGSLLKVGAVQMTL